MSDYQLTATDSVVIRTIDGASIPNDPGNRDWIEYQAWLDDGNVPDPYVAPDESPAPAPEDEVLYDHENRIRSLEGLPPLTQDEFAAKTAGEANASVSKTTVPGAARGDARRR